MKIMDNLLDEINKFSVIFLKVSDKQKKKVYKDTSLDLLAFEFTKNKVKQKVYSLYLNGKSTQDIRILTKLDNRDIDNIIDCYNYLKL